MAEPAPSLEDIVTILDDTRKLLQEHFPDSPALSFAKNKLSEAKTAVGQHIHNLKIDAELEEQDRREKARLNG